MTVVSPDGYGLDEYQLALGGALTKIGSVTVPDAIGAEGIAAS